MRHYERTFFAAAESQTECDTWLAALRAVAASAADGTPGAVAGGGGVPRLEPKPSSSDDEQGGAGGGGGAGLLHALGAVSNDAAVPAEEVPEVAHATVTRAAGPAKRKPSRKPSARVVE